MSATARNGRRAATLAVIAVLPAGSAKADKNALASASTSPRSSVASG